MAMEPTSSSDSSVTFLALIVGGLLVAVVLLFSFGAFDTTPDNKATISIDTPASTPAPATTP